MNRPRRWAGTVLALWTAVQVSACDAEFTAPEADESSLRVDSTSELVAGQEATLYGAGLDELQDVTIDGVPVSFRSVSEAEATVQVPDGAECEVDGRPVEMELNYGAAAYEGPLRVQSTVQLEVGETKVLSAEDLRCLQISSAVQDYVFSIASLTDQATMDRVMSLRAGSGLSPVDGVSASVADANASVALSDDTAAEVDVAAAAAQAEFGEPFDDYANAQEGDILTFVDWSDLVGIHNATTKEEVPTYQAEVVAIEGNQMFLLDLRSSPEERAEVEANVANLRAAAPLIDQHAVDAIRQTVHSDYTPVTAGTGGRILTMFTPNHGRATATPLGQELYAGLKWTSGMTVTRSASHAARKHSYALASLITHEMAHMADNQDREASSHGWYTEAVASSAAERFYRLYAGTERQAGWDGLHGPAIAHTPAYSHADIPLWGQSGQGPTAPMYDRGARILMYAQGLAGDEGFSITGPTLHERLVAQADLNGDLPDGRSVFSLEVIAEQVGMSAEELLRESWIADLVDDRVPEAAVARFGLPQIDRWDQAKLGDRPFLSVIERGGSLQEDVTIAGGNYAYWYIQGGEEVGVSIEGDDVDLQPHHEVRLIRLQ